MPVDGAPIGVGAAGGGGGSNGDDDLPKKKVKLCASYGFVCRRSIHHPVGDVYNGLVFFWGLSVLGSEKGQ